MVRLGGQALAVYAFGAPADCAYIGQFVNARSVFINDIPLSLTGITYSCPADSIVGPAFPHYSGKIDPVLRYTNEMLSTSKLFSVSTTSTQVNPAFLTTSKHTLLQMPQRSDGKRIDFFLQGLLVGGFTLLSLTTTTIALTGWAAWKYVK